MHSFASKFLVLNSCALLIGCLGLGVISAQALGEQAPFTGKLSPLNALLDDQSALTDTLRDFKQETEKRVQALPRQQQELSQEELEALGKLLTQEMLDLRKAFEMAVRRFSQSPRLHNYYGEVLYDWYGDIPSAVKEWNFALLYDEDFDAAHNNLGLHYVHAGNYKQGLRHLGLALKGDKDHPDYLFNMAQIYLVHGPQVAEIKGWKKAKVYKEAMKLSKKAAKEAPKDFEILQDYAVNFFAAENFEVKADWKDAAEAWEKARAEARTEMEQFYCWLNEARVWMRKGSPDKAQHCLSEAKKIQPESQVVQTLEKELGEKSKKK